MSGLVFGKTGQVARELAALKGVTCVGRERADLSDPAACAALIAKLEPDFVINAAAYTAVDKCETDEDAAGIINGDAPAAMARACAALGTPFVHISTDYVFDGSGEAAFTPHDTPAPLNAYGRTKLLGEDGIRAAGGRFAILRTSWVFSTHGNNFVKTMLRVGAERDELTVVADQIGGPTAARDIAQACMDLATSLGKGGPSGTYHFAGTPNVSWAQFAREIFAQAQMKTKVRDIATADYPTPATRPLNSRLDCSLIEQKHGISGSDWQAALAQVLSELPR
ncbi:dTDP-4-dehydrorhamnose reductase [uncultured Litoreibacter sp.]|uniref:dTDP-4-dehydrorhamnose reductase n=1 Tax=uncultured Litoreibacter sp. TaxID=1392394 RepID=UPI0026099E36|nr:dTDP-4-dehydrorhamnose reductase [uncultured Litoreibacter sp.]